MRESDIVILNGGEVLSLLEGREPEIVEVVRLAYEAHARGESTLPHSMFLRFPEEERNRIIALPAYLGDGFAVAGIKWISSFPGNLDRGMERASAVVILNSTETGRARAIIEGSAISAKRTAASAALAARRLHDGDAAQVGVIGCGLIGFELVRFMLATLDRIESLLIFDRSVERAEQFREKCRELSDKIEVRLAPDAETVLQNCPLTALATTATTPHIQDLSRVPPRATILHVSLRDLTPEVILSCDNVADDIDHISRAQTSIHLAEQLTGGRDFVRCTLGDILLGRASARSEAHETTVFSPFGLGILDLAVAHFIFEEALRQGLGTVVESFFPAAWTERTGSS
ncbi:MAG TPA: 2,3-diaminopropionate biosynthesis protein SbnB [Pyrinomonadaceae bacterium]|nr:2,3-diaminopropionate biosynthesis protein SbnB [Pyrinomonadaceae bacterium]